MRTCPHDNYMHCAGKLARAAPITPTCVSLCDTTTYFTIHLPYHYDCTLGIQAGVNTQV